MQGHTASYSKLQTKDTLTAPRLRRSGLEVQRPRQLRAVRVQRKASQSRAVLTADRFLLLKWF